MCILLILHHSIVHQIFFLQDAFFIQIMLLIKTFIDFYHLQLVYFKLYQSPLLISV